MSTLVSDTELLERALCALPTDTWYDGRADGEDFVAEPMRSLHASVNLRGLDLNADGLPSDWQVKKALHIASLAKAQRTSPEMMWLDRFADTFGQVKKYRPPPSHAPRGAPGKPAMRKEIARLALYFHLVRDQIDYDMGRPIKGVNPFIAPKRLDNGRWVWDCSGFVTYLYRAGTKGKVDPNGNGFSGYGFTGTLVSHGNRVSVPKVADLIFFGRPAMPGGRAHVGVFVEPGLDGRIVHMGSPPGPLLSENDYRSDFHSIRRYI